MPPRSFKSEPMGFTTHYLDVWCDSNVCGNGLQTPVEDCWGIWTPKNYWKTSGSLSSSWHQLATAAWMLKLTLLQTHTKYSWDRMRIGNGRNDVIWGAGNLWRARAVPSAYSPSKKIHPRDHSPNTCHQCGKRQKWPCPNRGQGKEGNFHLEEGRRNHWINDQMVERRNDDQADSSLSLWLCNWYTLQAGVVE